MNWEDLYTGRFFTAGTLYYDAELREHRESKYITTSRRIAVYETTDNARMLRNPDIYPTDTSLRPSLIRMLRTLPIDTRSELIKIYDRAEAFARQHTDDWAASGLVVNPPGTVVPEHRHFDVSKMTLTYVISNLVSENNSTLYIGDQAIEFPKNQREFFFCLDSNMNHYTTRQESDLNCYLFFTFDDVATTLEPNKFYVQPNT